MRQYPLDESLAPEKRDEKPWKCFAPTLEEVLSGRSRSALVCCVEGTTPEPASSNRTSLVSTSHRPLPPPVD